MNSINVQRKSWKEVLKEDKPLLLPVAHDALTARLIQRAGFKAYQIGGFAVVGAMHAVPDIDLEHYGEKSGAVEKIISASPLPVMVDADDGYGDSKNVTRTVQEYAKMGVSALFIEDQAVPIKCGHMADKHIVPVAQMEDKIKAAVAARGAHDLFLLARTDAIQPEGIKHAIKRAERYLKAGADGVYLEGPTDKEQLEEIGKAFKGVPLATSVLERGGKTPWLSPAEFGALGYSMVLYPATIIFQVTHTIELALDNLRKGRQMQEDISVTMDQFEDIVDLQYWKGIEEKYGKSFE
jgi:2-methylisocitrate lyase-like PEP mutase family enzyme